MIRITPADSKEILDPIHVILQKVLFPHLDDQGSRDIDAHLAWMKMQKKIMVVNCRIETLPDESTSIHFKISFAEIGNA